MGWLWLPHLIIMDTVYVVRCEEGKGKCRLTDLDGNLIPQEAFDELVIACGRAYSRKSELDVFFPRTKLEEVDNRNGFDLSTQEGRAALQEKLSSSWRQKFANEDWQTYNKGKYRKLGAVSGEEQQKLDWTINQLTGLSCKADSQWLGWRKGLAELYQEAQGDFDVLEKAIRKAWLDWKPGSPQGFIKAVRIVSAQNSLRVKEDKGVDERLEEANSYWDHFLE